MTAEADIAAFLTSQLADPETQWSIGSFGAIAEFARDADEPVSLSSLSVVTGRGAIRVDPAVGLRPIAFETTTKVDWSQRIALCMPEDRCAMNGRTVLTELGPDTGALRPQDRGAILFDLGLETMQVDCCVRTADPDVAARLRAHCGHPAFASPAMGIILAASPHRVFMSRLGRIEVFQPIPPPHGKSPDGPHTHVLPKLLRSRRTHSATEPIPDGFVPCAHVNPAHPAKDAMGRQRPFDPARYEAFQSILRAYGDPKFVALKRLVRDAVGAGADPSTISVPGHRFALTNIRVALRQLKAEQDEFPMLAAWLAAHERGTHDEATEEAHHQEAHAP